MVTYESKHAEKRKVQRSVPPLILEWLHVYGAQSPAGDGCEIVSFDKKSRRQLAKRVGRAAQSLNRLGGLLNAYAVIGSDGTLVTVGWRYKRIKH